jgi:hypothetical protein
MRKHAETKMRKACGKPAETCGNVTCRALIDQGCSECAGVKITKIWNESSKAHAS